MGEFDNETMEEWKDGRMKDDLPRRHGGHKGSTKMEQFDNVIIRRCKEWKPDNPDSYRDRGKK